MKFKEKRTRNYLILLIACIALTVVGCQRTDEPAGAVSTQQPGESTSGSSADASAPDAATSGLAEQKPTLPPLPAPTQGPYLPTLPAWGIEMYYLGEDIGLDLVTESGAYWVRRNGLSWADVEPTEGARNWEALAGLESELQSAAAQGLQVILIVRGTPEWAQATPGSLCSAPKPEKLAAFGALMHDLVSRYSLPPYKIQYWEIGNEPDVAPELVPSDAPFGCWGTTGDEYYGGGYYAEILKAVYPQVKAANPQAQVLVGGLLLDCDPVNPPETSPGSGELKDCTPARYLEGILVNGGGSFFDGISYHAYDYYPGEFGQYNNSNWNSAWNTTGPALIAKANYLRGVLNLYGVSGKYLLNTEAALLCGRDGNEPECQTEDYNLTKASYLAQSYVNAIAERLLANVWYSLTGWRASGLVDPSMTPTPAFDAFTTSAEQLNGAGFRGAITEFEGLRGYEFDRDGAQLWVLWSIDGEEHSIELEREPQAVTDVLGAALETTQELQVSLTPVYVLFPK